MLPEPIELPEQRAVFFPELVGRGPPPPAPPLMPPPLPVAPPPVAAPDDDDDRSVASSFSATSAALSIESNPTATTSKFWGVGWDKRERWWRASYTDANGKRRTIGRFDTQEAAAHAVNAAIRRAGLVGKRRMNPVDANGRLVPKPPGPHNKKRRREEPDDDEE